MLSEEKIMEVLERATASISDRGAEGLTKHLLGN
jgi:hypothetical protein